MYNYKHLLTAKQKKNIKCFANRGSLTIRPTIRRQLGGRFLGSLLASIDVPITVDLVSKLFHHHNQKEMEEQLLGLVCISHLCSLALHKNIPMSNHDLIEWCEYPRIPINNVLSRDHVPHKRK